MANPPTSYPKSAFLKPVSVPQPVIRRSRSWRGIMQVRYDDSKSDRGKIIRQIVFWSPLRVFGLMFLTLSMYYTMTGHDNFMLQLFGYESENTFEERINRTPAVIPVPGMTLTKAFDSPVRKLEVPLYTERKFDEMMKK